MAESIFVELKATISEFKSKMAEARGEMSATSKHGTSTFESLGKASGVALAGIAGAAVAAIGVAIKTGNDLEDAQVKLGKAIANTGGSMATLTGPIDAANKRMEKFGFTNAQTDDALAVLTTALGDPKKALADLSIAADLAKFKNIDLSTASIAVAKAQEGQLRPLKLLGIDLPVAASSAEKVAMANDKVTLTQAKVNAILKQFPDAANPASKAHAKYEKAITAVRVAQARANLLAVSGKTIVEALAQKLGGQASAAADTFSGKTEAAKVKLEDMAAKIGLKLIPIIEQLITWVGRVVDWFGRHKKAAEVLAATILTVLGGAMVIFTVNKIAQFVGGISKAAGALGGLAGRSRATAAVVESDSAAMGAASTGFGAKLSSGLAVATAGVLAFQGTTALLKSNFLGIGDAVKSAAGAIGKFLGIAQVAPQYSPANSTIMWMEQIASGQLRSADYTAAQARADLHKAHIPGYALGIPFVPQTGLAMLHQGEAVIPAGMNHGGGTGTTINVYVSGQVVTPDGLALSLIEPLRKAAARGPHRNSVKTFLS